MIGFQGRQRWRQRQLFKLRAKPLQCKIYIYFNSLCQSPNFLAGVYPHAKFAIRLFLELRFAYFLCAAQEISRYPIDAFQASPVTAIIGLGAIPSPAFMRKS
jgi:hypothetical protein